MPERKGLSTPAVLALLALGYLILVKQQPRGTYVATPGGTILTIPGVGTAALAPGAPSQIGSLFTNLFNRLGGQPPVMQTQIPSPWYDPSTAGITPVGGAAVAGATMVAPSDIIAAPDPYGVNPNGAASLADASPLLTGDPLVSSAYMPSVDSTDSVIGLVGGPA
jgi:hypothetical protein